MALLLLLLLLLVPSVHRYLVVWLYNDSAGSDEACGVAVLFGSLKTQD
jgi:hypothetical protein